MHFDIVTLFPSIWPALEHGIIERCYQQQLYTRTLWQLREFADQPDGRIDDKPYGGGPGMLMQYAPLTRCIKAIKQKNTSPTHVIQLDPTGEPLDQSLLQTLLKKTHITLICGRYEGIDQRFTNTHVDTCVSVGKFVLSGGDLPAMLMVDALVRQLPGALGNALSSTQDSYQTWLLDHPHYTRPSDIDEQSVPKVLLSGDHQAISTWQRQQQLGRTWLAGQLINQTLNEKDTQLLKAFIKDLNH